MRLSDSVWLDVTRDGIVPIPLGSTVQHGPLLPLDTDTTIAQAVADELAPLLGARVAPPMPYGAVGGHQDFPGTVSIGTPALAAALVELGRSLGAWAAQVVFVNGYGYGFGGNLTAIVQAVARLRSEGRNASWVPCAPRGRDLHAGRCETSLMLHLAPTRVRLRQAEAGNTSTLEDLTPQLHAGRVASVSLNGVLGDPAGASSTEGAELLRRMVSDAYERVRTQILVAN
jgi:mycofactocin system creatininase family protein